MPVKIQLTNSLEGMPYIINCWEVEEARGGKGSPGICYTFSVTTSGEIMKSSHYLLACFLAIEKWSLERSNHQKQKENSMTCISGL